MNSATSLFEACLLVATSLHSYELYLNSNSKYIAVVLSV